MVNSVDSRYYLGISPARLKRYFNTAKVSTSSKIFTCLVLHLFSAEAEYADYRQSTTYRVLAAVSRRPPRNTPVEFHLVTSRLLLGNGLADRLALPPAPPLMLAPVKLGHCIQWSLIAFGRCWRTGWEVERVTITRTLVTMLVTWQLGERRTRFVSKPFGTLAEVMKDDPDWEEMDPSIEMGPAAGQKIVKRWKWLLGEMAAVILAGCASVFSLTYVSYKLR